MGHGSHSRRWHIGHGARCMAIRHSAFSMCQSLLNFDSFDYTKFVNKSCDIFLRWTASVFFPPCCMMLIYSRFRLNFERICYGPPSPNLCTLCIALLFEDEMNRCFRVSCLEVLPWTCWTCAGLQGFVSFGASKLCTACNDKKTNCEHCDYIRI